MKIFFTASQRGKKFYGHFYKKIYEGISRLGHQHLDDEVTKIEGDVFYQQLEKGGAAAYQKLFDHDRELLKTSDINIFEGSLSSLSIGYMIEKSLGLSKPTIVLYLKDNTPNFATLIQDEKLIAKAYTNLEDLPEILKSALEKAQQLKEKRFNFFINPDLLNYLEEASGQKGITKSSFIRNLILDHRANSKS